MIQRTIGAGGMCVAAAVAAVIAMCGATASAAEATGGDEIQEIVITAQFRSQNLQEAPLAVTAVDAALLEARGQTNIEAVAQSAPSVQFSAGGQGGGAQTAVVMIRGIGQTDFQFPNEPGVGVYIDDVYYGILFGTAFDLVDLDRVEILRGPQGTLAGKNSIGGSIKLFSQKPGADPNGYLEATVGSFDRVALRGATNLTLVPDKLYARISGINRHVDGYLDRLDYGCVHGVAIPGGTFAQARNGCVIGTDGGQDVTAVRGALRWIPSDLIEDNLSADVTRDRSQASAAKALFLPNPDYLTPPDSYTNYSTYTGYQGTANQYTNAAVSYLDAWGVTNTLDVTPGGIWSLKSISGYRYTEGESAWDGDNSPENISNNYSVFNHEQFTQELRVSVNLPRTELTAGAYYYDARSHVGGRVDVGVAGLDFSSWDPFKQTSKSAFAHAVFHATDKLNLTGGARYTREDKTYTFNRESPIPGVPTDPRVASLNGLSRGFKGDRVDWRVAVDYELVADVRAYAQVATGFKGGGVNPRPYLEMQVVPFKQETSTSYEAGIKSMLFDRRLRLNADYFHNQYKDYQGQVGACPDISPPGFPFCSATRNIGDAKIDGVELEFDARLLHGLSVDGSASYTDFRFTQAVQGSGITPGLTRAPFVPEWKYSLGAQYAFELGSGGRITPRVDWTYQSDMETNIPNGVTGFLYGHVDSRGLVNLRVPYISPEGDWEAAVAVTNVADKFYYSNKYDRYTQSGNAYGAPGRPREFLFSVKRNF
jgi:iron complex outermembrane receptor protein